MRSQAGEGLRGLYHGLSANLLKAVPSMSIAYVVFEQTKSLLGSKPLAPIK